MANRRLSLEGQTFGFVEVLSPAGMSERGATLWRCRCKKCGSEFVAVGYRLTTKTRPCQDCGCTHRQKFADLTGQTLGALDVLRREGTSSSGDRVYLCRCRICGREKLFPACTIRGLVKSCGCKAHDIERLRMASKQGALATCIDGCNVYTATRTAPDSDNTTGYRWVRVCRWKEKEYISAVFYIRGQRYYRGGFLSRESAYAWALAAHEEALQREGIIDPRKEEDEATHD